MLATLLGIVIKVNAVHPSKARLPIKDTELVIAIDVNAVQ